MIILAAMAAVTSGPAAAETLNIPIYRPAAVEQTALTPTIGIERFSGGDGAMLAQGIEKHLAAGRIDGSPWIEIRMMPAAVDGVLTGSANISVQTDKVREKRVRCVDRDKDGDCKKRDDVKVDCKRRMVSMSGFVRLAAASSGEVFWSRDLPREQVVTDCPGDTVPSAESVAQDMLQSAAADVAGALLPTSRRQDVRVRESRKGLPKDEANRFKAIVALTKTDEPSACDAWDAMAARLAPGTQESLVYNVALCAEKRGDENARSYWLAAQAVDPSDSDIVTALGRDSARATFEAQMEMRERYLSEN